MGPAIVIFVCLLGLASSLLTSGFSPSLSVRKGNVKSVLYGKEADKDEQFRIQQEMLRRRRDPKAKAENEARVEARREQATKTVRKQIWNLRVKTDEEDPLVKWKEAMDAGEIKDFGYPDEPPKEASLFGLNIPIPQSPIDVPKYDNGERFDLRLPYAERGYVDKDADVMAKVSNFFGRLLGGSEKDKEG